ncbi:MAG: HAMP domain-containing histidine kinase [Chitinophagaceae bacterium]|nr:HAMP domain-containing histidine kinase [Chitinophagaceae bacterium]
MNDTVGLMENLLQWSKSQMQSDASYIAEVDMNELVHDVANVLHLQAGTKKIEIKIHLPHSVIALADADMIHLVLRNLLSNAIKFTAPGGQVVIGAQPLDTHAEIYVKDFGNGIEPSVLAKIESGEFHTSFGTSQEQGTGLGLLLCREFLAKNNSQLRIETAEGKGSTFSFLLPQA